MSTTSPPAAVGDVSCPPAVQRRIAELGYGVPIRAETLHGGTISRVQRLVTSSGASLVMKTVPSPDGRPGPAWLRQPPEDFFRCEAIGLEALRGTPGLAIPAVLLVDTHALVLEDFGPQESWQRTDHLSDAYWESFGRSLAHLHGRLGSRFGFPCDTYWGPRRMDNRFQENGFRFYGEQRLRWFLTRPAGAQLSTAERSMVDAIIDRLPHLVPRQPACLTHGDLWAGNRVVSPTGGPGVIDPFVHYGWAEMDLAHGLLWGGFPPRFIDAYRESHPLESGWRSRSELYQMIILLAMIDEGYQWCLPRLRPILARWS